MATKYLDLTGAQYLAKKVKGLIDAKADKTVSYTINGTSVTTVSDAISELAKLSAANKSAIDGITSFNYVFVDDKENLPYPGVKGTIYLVPSENGNSTYVEYMFLTNEEGETNYEQLGTVGDINIEDYVKTTDLNTTLADYSKASELSKYATITSLTDYAKKSELSSYATTASLSDYAKTADVNTTLADYEKKSDLETTLAGYAQSSDLDDYVKTTTLTTTLADYAKTADVNTTLADYAKTADVNTTLADYATISSLDEYVKKSNATTSTDISDAVDVALANYSTSEEIAETYVKSEDVASISNDEIDDMFNSTSTSDEESSGEESEA